MGGEPLWVTIEEQGGIAATHFWPGSEAAIKGVRPTFWKPYNVSVANEDRIRQIFDWLDLPSHERPMFLTLYFSDLDQAGHRYGPDSPEIIEYIADADRLIGLVIAGLEQRELWGHLNLIITSDHGMTSLSRDRVVFLDDYLNLDAIEVINWGPLASIRPTVLSEEEVLEVLVNAHPNVHVVRKEEMPERFRYRNNDRIPPILAIADEGWMISSRSHFNANPSYATGGTHGFDHELGSMLGIFLAHGEAFAAGITSGPVAAIHIYELLAHILGLEPAFNEGDLESVRHLLR